MYLANATCRVLMIRLFSSPKLPHSRISWYWRTQMSICGVSYPILHENRKPRRYYDDVITWKHFPRYWPFVCGNHQPPVNSPHKVQWRGALMFSLIFAWMNGWVNNRDASDSRRNRAHYDVTVMILHWISFNWGWVVSVNYATIGSNDGLSSVPYQAIIWIGPLVINFNEIWSEIVCIYVHSFFVAAQRNACVSPLLYWQTVYLTDVGFEPRITSQLSPAAGWLTCGCTHSADWNATKIAHATDEPSSSQLRACSRCVYIYIFAGLILMLWYRETHI